MLSRLQGNVVKHIIVLGIGLLFFPSLSASLAAVDPAQVSDFLLVLSMLLVTVCFANFAFTYEKTHLSIGGVRLLAHSATGLFSLLILLMLASICFAIKEVYPSLYGVIGAFSGLLYIGVILYDFWDFLRAEG